MSETQDATAGGFELRDVCLARGGRRVLREVSFEAPKGAVTVLVAPSGAGKSTLLRCLNRLLVPDEGSVRLDGIDVAALDPCALRRRAGLLGQQPLMLPGSVRENLSYGLGEVPRERLSGALDGAGLDDAFLERPAQQLSGGERARVGLARALTRAPEMLLLDEPTAALDADAARHVAATLRELAAAGLGVILATHDLALAATIADRVVTLREGIARTGTPQDLLGREREGSAT